jgi:hypothetical protein
MWRARCGLTKSTEEGRSVATDSHATIERNAIFFVVRSGTKIRQRFLTLRPAVLSLDWHRPCTYFIYVYLWLTCTLHVNLCIFTNNGGTMTNDKPDLSSEGAPVIDKTVLVNVNRNKYPVVSPSWTLKPGLTDRLVVGCKVTLTFDFDFDVTTDDQSVSKSWFQGPCGSHDRIFISVEIYEYCFIDCGRPPLTRGRVCHFS